MNTLKNFFKFYFIFVSFLPTQDDKDLVHEFVIAEGLTCLIKVGAEADQNYQNYILRGESWQPLCAEARSSRAESFVRNLG